VTCPADVALEGPRERAPDCRLRATVSVLLRYSHTLPSLCAPYCPPARSVFPSHWRGPMCRGYTPQRLGGLPASIDELWEDVDDKELDLEWLLSEVEMPPGAARACAGACTLSEVPALPERCNAGARRRVTPRDTASEAGVADGHSLPDLLQPGAKLPLPLLPPPQK